MKNRHEYQVAIEWQGNTGSGTQTYSSYERTYSIQASSRSTIAGSSDPKFQGDPAFWSPENLLVASLSACHQLWYLSLCAKAGIVVAAYEDVAVGIMVEDQDGGGQFELIGVPKISRDSKKDCGEPGCPSDHRSQVFP